MSGSWHIVMNTNVFALQSHSIKSIKSLQWPLLLTESLTQHSRSFLSSAPNHFFFFLNLTLQITPLPFKYLSLWLMPAVLEVNSLRFGIQLSSVQIPTLTT